MPSFFDYSSFIQDLLSGRRASMETLAATWREKELIPYLDLKVPRSIIDLGSGSLSPQVEILSRSGHTVVGIDTVNRPVTSLKKFAYAFARQIYRHQLNAPKGAGKKCLICADVGRLPLASRQFDLVISCAAFEHFLEIPLIIEELFRVLRPGGVIWTSIHHFSSLSGGHNAGMRLGPILALPEGVEPWDHLRSRKTPFSVPLNEWRVAEYRSAFESRFEVIKFELIGEEGAALLTPEIRAELSEYTVDELTRPTLILAAKKNVP